MANEGAFTTTTEYLRLKHFGCSLAHHLMQNFAWGLCIVCDVFTVPIYFK